MQGQCADPFFFRTDVGLFFNVFTAFVGVFESFGGRLTLRHDQRQFQRLQTGRDRGNPSFGFFTGLAVRIDAGAGGLLLGRVARLGDGFLLFERSGGSCCMPLLRNHQPRAG